MVIEKANLKAQTSKEKRKVIEEVESEIESLDDDNEKNDDESLDDEGEDTPQGVTKDVDDDNENQPLHIDEATPLKDITTSRSSNRSQSSVSSKYIIYRSA